MDQQFNLYETAIRFYETATTNYEGNWQIMQQHFFHILWTSNSFFMKQQYGFYETATTNYGPATLIIVITYTLYFCCEVKDVFAYLCLFLFFNENLDCLGINNEHLYFPPWA